MFDAESVREWNPSEMTLTAPVGVPQHELRSGDGEVEPEDAKEHEADLALACGGCARVGLRHRSELSEPRESLIEEPKRGLDTPLGINVVDARSRTRGRAATATTAAAPCR